MDNTLLAAHDQHVREVARVSFFVALVAIVGVAVYLVQRPNPRQTPTGVADQLPPIVTPASFQNFVGPITVVGADGFAVRMTIVRPGGTQLQRDYEVKIDSATALSIYHDRATGPILQPASLADFHPGDRVSVYGQENLYSITSFTATKVYKIISS